MKKYTNKEFIEKAIVIHGNNYNYSKANYLGSRIEMIIICLKHGEFKQTPHKHLIGQGCPKCAGLNKTTNDFIFEAKQIYGNKYDYSLSIYENAKKKIKIVCSEHGVFEKTPDAHLRGNLMGGGCAKCGYEKNSKYFASSIDEFVQKANLIHGDKYDYSKVNYINAKINVDIICNKHGIFKQRPDNHLHNKGCPLCKISKGELAIKKYLDNYNIEYIKEKLFDDCRNKFQLPFDFYLPKNNMLIEYDGEQHFKSINYWGGDIGFKSRQINDEIKNNFAKNNNIDLLRIKYNEINNINQILKEII